MLVIIHIKAEQVVLNVLKIDKLVAMAYAVAVLVDHGTHIVVNIVLHLHVQAA
jgi:hypothetical protein